MKDANMSAAIVDGLVDGLRRAATQLPGDVIAALGAARERESSERAAAQLDAILDNVRIAGEGALPICQDTGVQTFFVEAGERSPHLSELRAWMEAAVGRATEEIPLRPNTVDPLTGENPGDNSGRGMPLIHWAIVEGDAVRIVILPKGGGSENMSALKMLPPGVGLKGIKKAIVDHVIACGGKPCPPTVLGIGIGGGADIAMNLGKHAVLRPLGSAAGDPRVAALEREILALVNATGVGAMGVGGDTSCLAVHVEIAHRHPASLPLGILVQCWADRRATVHLDAAGRIEVS
jgi:fumarate hydratase subunit alpha